MTNQQWTEERLSRLADQVEQIGSQLGELGNRVEQICGSVDRLVALMTTSLPAASTSAKEIASPPEPLQLSLTRLTALEAQVQQLTQRLSDLERQHVTQVAESSAQERTSLIGLAELEDEEIDDEPDEILWDFMEPSDRQ